ncbi:hypothetical protein GCM10022392_10770 [Mucilaginibacter panaciglaebae]|uniref:Uncharacterized protein n=1 Tax=Mucilaginibacter panaciglaebae TaxID=502331 RepID=A0ABP7WME6_9SPHI
MKNLPVKKFKKKTNTLYRYNRLSGINQSDTTVGETDPTNTTITVLTTTHLLHKLSPLKLMP